MSGLLVLLFGRSWHLVIFHYTYNDYIHSVFNYLLLSGKAPYREKDNNQVKDIVCHERGHLTVPAICPTKLSKIVTQCWAYNANDRPSFKSLKKVIEELVNEDNAPFYSFK